MPGERALEGADADAPSLAEDARGDHGLTTAGDQQALEGRERGKRHTLLVASDRGLRGACSPSHLGLREAHRSPGVLEQLRNSLHRVNIPVKV
jgi:hypothetical protein